MCLTSQKIEQRVAKITVACTLPAGGYSAQSAALETEARDGVAVAFGRYFISNVGGWAHALRFVNHN